MSVVCSYGKKSYKKTRADPKTTMEGNYPEFFAFAGNARMNRARTDDTSGFDGREFFVSVALPQNSIHIPVTVVRVEKPLTRRTSSSVPAVRNRKRRAVVYDRRFPVVVVGYNYPISVHDYRRLLHSGRAVFDKKKC